ncbi:single-stranded DNA endonuclease [Pseudozyma hubeiensis SY62]|uniref:Single-stranded DNA endonuclease n=1 Tax=Pseudozyma hubeiensis (strain SY62) TaxID=1305764 RepID=R9PAT2_PSEHS|nr:single-stranded DNA endonuclease [Pseudozyma hubeiensis SY62]GAC95200.1 single-stranded DNA endonuclease [Pseudozyma hubeiensis SY62]DBA11365.1 TPA_inf: RAD1 [Pseudozyma hubeiensis]
MSSHNGILQRAGLLPFHCQIVNSLVPGPDDSPDEGDALVIVARGLGLRRIVSTILRIYDSPNSLVLLVNATSEEESGIGEELTTLGVRKPGLRAIHHEMPAKQRSEMYLSGGIMSVTSRILVVDMLSKRIPTGLITGLVVLHAEKVTPTSVEAFIARIYRQENKEGFLKAFSDNPEHFTMGISPLQTVLSQLRIRKVELWPRFHQQTSKDLGQRKADVIELHQPLTRSMRNIQTAIIECLDASLSELKRGNANVETDDFSIEHAIFRAFDVVVRRQLDPIWHRVSAKTKQLVGDLTTLRNLLNYLLTYDSVTFNSYLETILASSTTTAKGTTRQNQSAWLFMDAANVIFHEAKRRVYVWDESRPQQPLTEDQSYADDEEALRQAEGSRETLRTAHEGPIPPEVEPVLEENPKWHLLQEVLDEVEQEIHFNVAASDSEAGNTILIMCGSERTSMQLRQIISSMDECPPGQPGKKLMQQLLKSYFLWKGGLGKINAEQKEGQESGDTRTTSNAAQGSLPQAGPINEALKRKLAYQKGQQAYANKRRRQRGGSSVQSSSGRFTSATDAAGQASFQAEAAQVSDYIASTANGNENEDSAPEALDAEQISDEIDEVEFDAFFGLLSMENLVVVRSYRGDQDDKVLQELRPRFVIMYDPDPAFVRRVEVYRSTNPGVGVRVYFLIYADSVEEQRYLSALRREKESFERLIREKSMMALPLSADGRPIAEDADQRFLRTISSRVAGGQRSATAEPPRIIVDMREFRSSLPSMLHAADIQVIPCTLQVGDYVLTPTMCVERKSLSDLIQSFNSGRLYTQCELMCVHYQHPILLIEFDQDKSFSLKSTADGKMTGRAAGTELDVQAKLVLLTSAFPRLRIIWSSSPFATSDIFADLKQNFDEPDAAKVALVGLDDVLEAEGGTSSEIVRRADWQSSSEHSFNLGPQDLLRALPGVNTKNFRYIMSQVRDISDLCSMSQEDLSELIGVEPARQLTRFLERGL